MDSHTELLKSMTWHRKSDLWSYWWCLSFPNGTFRH